MIDNKYVELGKKISKTRSERGLSQDALVKMLQSEGVSIIQKTLSNYENGSVKNPKADIIRAIAKSLSIPDLFDGYFRTNTSKEVGNYQWQDASELAIKQEHLTGRSFEDIISRYKHDLTNPPMVKDEIVAYRTIVNSHSTPDILINVLYRLDNLEGK